jgi:tetratricopeptide (TPR) repeat protein
MNETNHRFPWLRLSLPIGVVLVVCATVALVPAFSPVLDDGASIDVVLQSNPAGASAYVNGSLAGATPVLLKDMHPGTYSLRLEKSGFETLSRKFVVSRPAAIKESLQRLATAELTVAIKPDGAQVFLDGELQGITPLQLPQVPVGWHELVVSKPNYDSYVQRIEVSAGQPLAYKNFDLDNKILAMLKANVAKERWRVSHYLDLAHYLFVNDRLGEAADIYAQALSVATTQIEFPGEYSQDDRSLEIRLRAEDVNRLNEELRHKEHWPGKELTTFRRVIDNQRELLSHTNYTNWKWVQEQASSYVQENRYDEAQSLLGKHIETIKTGPNIEQAQMMLLSVRMRIKSMDTIRNSFRAIVTNYTYDPSLMRQAACAIYGDEKNFDPAQRKELLAMSEELLRRGLATAQKKKEAEQIVLLNLNLGNVLMLQGHADQAEPCYRASVDGSSDVSTKEDRMLRQLDCFKALKKWDDARKLLDGLIKSKRQEIVDKAQQEQKAIELLDPSPDNK